MHTKSFDGSHSFSGAGDMAAQRIIDTGHGELTDQPWYGNLHNHD